MASFPALDLKQAVSEDLQRLSPTGKGPCVLRRIMEESKPGHFRGVTLHLDVVANSPFLCQSINHLLGHVKELIQINTPIGKLPEGTLLLLLHFRLPREEETNN